jgi:ribosomal protein S18 acetylase RimI-like enzyme
MAAATESRTLELADLREVPAASLTGLLDEEIAEWLERLSWDFRPSAGLVQRFVGAGSLTGCALMAGGSAAGYTYFVHEDHKGLIGDLYIRKSYYSPESEARLLKAALDELFHMPRVERIESQLMLLRSPGDAPLPFPEGLTVHARNFMAVEMAVAATLRPGRAARKILVENWSPRHQDDAARVIAQAYAGHVDSAVNDQYRSVEGARRFLNNIVQYPGCGIFHQPSSFLALDAWTGRACGISLCSILSPHVGHITQICVAPQLKGKGVGYELLRRSLLALREAGCRKASLTVTAANTDAVRLYERVGFRVVHTFRALVWERRHLPAAGDQP